MSIKEKIQFGLVACALVIGGVETASAQQEREIAELLERRLAAATSQSMKVRFSVQGSTVTMWGEVPTEAARNTVLQTARATPGVTTVNGELGLNPGLGSPAAQLSDDEVRANLIQALRNAGVSNVDALGVSVAGGEATLVGSRPTFQAVDRILSVALNVDGVKQVHSKIEVGDQPYSALNFSPR